MDPILCVTVFADWGKTRPELERTVWQIAVRDLVSLLTVNFRNINIDI